MLKVKILGSNWIVLSTWIQMKPIGLSSTFSLSPKPEQSSARKSCFVPSPSQAKLGNFKFFRARAEQSLDFDFVTEPSQPSSSSSQLGTLCSMFTTDSVWVSQTAFACHRYALSVPDSLCQSQTICVCHRQSFSVTDSIGLLQTICVSHIQCVSMSVTSTLPDCSWQAS